MIDVDEFIGRLRDLMWAVAANSDIYGTYHEEVQLRDFLLATDLFTSKRSN